MNHKGGTLTSWMLGVGAVLVLIVISHGHVAITSDSITYIAAAESLHGGHGLGTWLEHPLVVFPPLWPILIAAGMTLGMGAETSALVLISASMLVIPPLTLATMRRCTTSSAARWGAVVTLTTSPMIISWAFGALSEVPFIALVLVVILLAVLSTEHGPRPLWGSVVVASIVPLIRYAGVGVPLALMVWIFLSTPGRSRYLRTATAAVIGLGPLGAVVLRNVSLVDAPFGVREPSRLSLPAVLQQCLTGFGRSVTWGLDVGPRPLLQLIGVVLIAASAVAVVRATRPAPWFRVSSWYSSDSTDGEDPTVRRPEFGPRLLVAGIGAAQVVVMVWSRSRVEFDNLGPRLLAPATILFTMLVFALIGDLMEDHPSLSRVLQVAIVCWCLVGIPATARFVLRPELKGYDQPEYEAVRDSEILEHLPDSCDSTEGTGDDATTGCLVMANEPWVWYRSPFRPQISPRNFAPADDDDITMIMEALDEGDRVFILWTTVTEPKDYLLGPEELPDRIDLTELGGDTHLDAFEVGIGP